MIYVFSKNDYESWPTFATTDLARAVEYYNKSKIYYRGGSGDCVDIFDSDTGAVVNEIPGELGGP